MRAAAAALIVGCSAPPITSAAPGHDNLEPTEGPRVTTAAVVEADPLQGEILEDASVTHAEMERALLAVVSCMNEQGLSASLVEFDQGHGWQFETSGQTPEEADVADAAFDICYNSFLSQVEVVYIEEHGPTELELQQRNERLISCLGELGYQVEGTPFAELVTRVDPGDLTTCDEQSS